MKDSVRGAGGHEHRRDHAAVPPSGGALRSLVAERLGHAFDDPALLREALTHASAAGRGRRGRSNERLEFLGDRVLGLVMANTLIKAYPDEPEGALSRRHAALVRRETLAEVAQELGIGDWLTVARSEEDGGRSNPAILADTLEALIGAIYLDGGLEAVESFIRRAWRDRVRTMAAPPRDAKTALQEWAQARGLDLPLYEVVGTAGPPHAPTFEVEVRLATGEATVASAGSKRAAEQAAAVRLLERLGGHD
jgi:ribonuclease III